jgi:hypothetical protein
MWKWLCIILKTLRSSVRKHREPALENLALRQRLVEACGTEEKPKYLLRDRDAIYGEKVSQRARTLDIKEVLTTYRSRWQNPYAERVIGSIRRITY